MTDRPVTEALYFTRIAFQKLNLEPPTGVSFSYEMHSRAASEAQMTMRADPSTVELQGFMLLTPDLRGQAVTTRQLREHITRIERKLEAAMTGLNEITNSNIRHPKRVFGIAAKTIQEVNRR